MEIAVENPLKDDIRVLIAALDETLLALSPREHCHHLTVEQLADGSTTLFVAREGGVAIACGALKRHANGVGEVKRMYTVPSHQGRGIGGRILWKIEATARAEGLRELVLETGDKHPWAWRTYERCGFARCGVVLDYPDTKWSVFYKKDLAA
jgi:putative acetyltransferase